MQLLYTNEYKWVFPKIGAGPQNGWWKWWKPRFGVPFFLETPKWLFPAGFQSTAGPEMGPSGHSISNLMRIFGCFFFWRSKAWRLQPHPHHRHRFFFHGASSRHPPGFLSRKTHEKKMLTVYSFWTWVGNFRTSDSWNNMFNDKKIKVNEKVQTSNHLG